jgi:Protein of unknown function (DUF3421)
LKPKGFWRAFNITQGFSDAFSAGTDSEGKEIYIGRGIFNGEIIPGRFLFEDDGSHLPGLYVEQKSCELFFSTGVEYYAKNPSCNYQWVASSDGSTVPNAVRVSRFEDYYIGKVTIDGSIHVGKVSRKEKVFTYPGYSSNSYEVLVCQRENCEKLRIDFINNFFN